MFRARAALRTGLILAAVACLPVLVVQASSAGAPAHSGGTAVAIASGSMVWD
ncbi:hypothetical protein [Streptomyces yokosukanensis]|uniref:hypothetical protein n=1 Tax=Streptomyces yokosukanensis TaxID=67386 RepID=UPI000B02C073|nr:hypothetical protein [Streptomyces yokosukanensis]